MKLLSKCSFFGASWMSSADERSTRSPAFAVAADPERPHHDQCAVLPGWPRELVDEEVSREAGLLLPDGRPGLHHHDQHDEQQRAADHASPGDPPDHCAADAEGWAPNPSCFRKTVVSARLCLSRAYVS